MNISQDAFNKIITITLFLYFLVMYTISYITGKPLDFYNALVMLVPTINHVVAQMTQAQVVTSNIQAQKDVVVAQTTATPNGH